MIGLVSLGAEEETGAECMHTEKRPWEEAGVVCKPRRELSGKLPAP